MYIRLEAENSELRDLMVKYETRLKDSTKMTEKYRWMTEELDYLQSVFWDNAPSLPTNHSASATDLIQPSPGSPAAAQKYIDSDLNETADADGGNVNIDESTVVRHRKRESLAPEYFDVAANGSVGDV